LIQINAERNEGCSIADARETGFAPHLPGAGRRGDIVEERW
jgi:hypothetical protein